MPINVAGFQLLAERLIRENGRVIQLVVNPSVDEGGALHNPLKPWRGVSRDAPALAASEISTPFYFEMRGVFVDYNENTSTGLTIQQGDKNLLVAYLDAGTDGYIITGKEKVIDDGSDWFIMNANIVQPGDLFVYFDLQVRR